MKAKVMFFINEINKVKKIIHPSILSASLVYFFILVFIPLNNIIVWILSLLKITNDTITINIPFLSFILLGINLLYVSSKIVYALKKSCEAIFKMPSPSDIITRLKSVLLIVFIILFIIAIIILRLVIINLFNKININIVLSNLFEFLYSFFGVTVVISILIKKAIPYTIPFKRTFKLSLIINTISYIFIKVYFLIYQNFKNPSIIYVYGSGYSFFLTIILLYYFFLVIIYSIIIENIVYNKEK